jgi:signal peptidase I
VDCLHKDSNTLGCELAAEIVRRFGMVKLRVTGTSMAPAIHPGDILAIRRATIAEVSPGSIVLFARQSRLFAHRVVEKNNDSLEPCLLTRGDRLLQDDAPVTASELLGYVTSIARGRRQILPPVRLNRTERALGCLLRFSDRATGLYLRLASRSGEPSAAGTSWQA